MVQSHCTFFFDFLQEKMVHCPLQIREKDLNISEISFHPHMKLIIKQIPIKMTEYHPQTFAEQQLV